jgi:cyclohexadienyl dehydratase
MIRFAILVLAAMLPLQAMAADPGAPQTVLARILARGTIRVGMTGDYKPFDILDGKTGAYQGIDAEMAQNLAKALGVKLEIVKTTWPTLMQGLLARKYDIAMGGITITLDRLKTAYFSTPVLRAGKIPLTLCRNAARFATLAQIDQPGVTVVVNPGGTNMAFDRANLHQAKLLVVDQNTETFGTVLDGKADLMITDNVEARLQHRLHPELCAVHPNHPFNFAELGYMMPQDGALKSFVDQWVRIELKTGAYARATQEWMR